MRYYLNKVKKKVIKWWGLQWSGGKWREEVFRAATPISWGELQVRKEVEEEGKKRKNTGSQNTKKWILTNSSGWGSYTHWCLLKHTMGVMMSVESQDQSDPGAVIPHQLDKHSSWCLPPYLWDMKRFLLYIPARDFRIHSVYDIHDGSRSCTTSTALRFKGTWRGNWSLSCSQIQNIPSCWWVVETVPAGSSSKCPSEQLQTCWRWNQLYTILMWRRVATWQSACPQSPRERL